VIRQKTYDLLDLRLRTEYKRYRKLPGKDRYKLLSHTKYIDPVWSDLKFKEIKKFSLKWSTSIKYSSEPDLDTIITSNDPGIYFFYVKPKNQILGMPSFITYVGIAGEKKPRALRERLKEYFYISNIKKRSNVHTMFQIYLDEIYFSYAFYKGSAFNLRKLETSLTEYFQPKWSSRDYEPETKQKKAAW